MIFGTTYGRTEVTYSYSRAWLVQQLPGRQLPLVVMLPGMSITWHGIQLSPCDAGQRVVTPSKDPGACLRLLSPFLCFAKFSLNFNSFVSLGLSL